MPYNPYNTSANTFNLYTIINNTPDAIWCIDANFTLIAANKAFFQLRSTNHRLPLQIGESVFTHSGQEAVEKWQAVYNRAIAGEVVFLEELKEIDGRQYYYDMNITPVYDEGYKKLIACVAIAKDVSGRKKAEQAVSAYGKRFKSFTFKTAHELRNPLTNILALVELGKDEKITLAELKVLFALLGESSKQLDAVVTELVGIVSKQNAS